MRSSRVAVLLLTACALVTLSAVAAGSSASPLAARTAAPIPSAPCVGDGVSGARIQVLYGVPADRPDDYANKVDDIHRAVDAADWAFTSSDAATEQHLRWRCTAGTVAVDRVVLPPVGPDGAYGFAEVRTGVRGVTTGGQRTKAAYRDPEHIYVVFVDGLRKHELARCGYGDMEADDRPGPSNSNNTGPAYSLVGCWDGPSALHEIGHNLGAVQSSAPHTSGSAHCYDEADVMCYDDRGPHFTGSRNPQRGMDAGELQDSCPDRPRLAGTQTRHWRFDCNLDDYYNPDPAPGSYLDTHWNVADSKWVVG